MDCIISFILLTIPLFLLPTVSSCPPQISCVTGDTKFSCDEQSLYYQENVFVEKCCPGCIKLPGLEENCTIEQGCKPGYICSEETQQCQKDPLQVCAIAREKAEKLGEWVPECTPEGLYEAKQCKGEFMSGKCFCFEPNGKRIFGEIDWNDESENMTCGCSSLNWEMKKDRTDVTIHCTDQGSFEELQCDDELCWCARETDGKPFSLVVPENMMKSLPCFDSKSHGDNYLRNCDSIEAAREKTKNLLTIHGTTNIVYPTVSCNYDGSFARVQVTSSGTKECVRKDNKKISQYEIPATENNVNCNCEYDRFLAERPFLYQCDNKGSYVSKQNVGSESFCVDEDGFYTPTGC